ncbi:unnamed protein product, partial [Allacma fusca]
TTHNVVRK